MVIEIGNFNDLILNSRFLKKYLTNTIFIRCICNLNNYFYIVFWKILSNIKLTDFKFNNNFLKITSYEGG